MSDRHQERRWSGDAGDRKTVRWIVLSEIETADMAAEVIGTLDDVIGDIEAQIDEQMIGKKRMDDEEMLWLAGAKRALRQIKAKRQAVQDYKGRLARKEKEEKHRSYEGSLGGRLDMLAERVESMERRLARIEAERPMPVEGWS